MERRFEGCRAEADAGTFDAELAQVIGQRMFDDYQNATASRQSSEDGLVGANFHNF